ELNHVGPERLQVAVTAGGMLRVRGPAHLVADDERVDAVCAGGGELGAQPELLRRAGGAAVAGILGREIVAVGVEHDDPPTAACRVEGVVAEAGRGAAGLV